MMRLRELALLGCCLLSLPAARADADTPVASPQAASATARGVSANPDGVISPALAGTGNAGSPALDAAPSDPAPAAAPTGTRESDPTRPDGPPAPDAQRPTDAAQPAAVKTAPAEDPKFDLLELRVVGNTVLKPIDIERAVYPFLGPQKTIKDVERARDALQAVYQSKGYLTVAVNIPEQKVDRGVVELSVLEGKVSKLRVTGSRYYSLGRIREKAAELAPGQVPNFKQVQKELGDLNRTEDRRVAPVLKPGRAPGTVEAELRVEDKPAVHGEVELNNRNTASTSPWRVSGSARYENLWQLEHSLSLQYQFAPERPKDASVLVGTYLWPLREDRTLALYAVHSDSDVNAVGTVGVVGKGDIAGARYVATLPSSAGYFHSITAGADYKHFRESLKLLGADTVETPITYEPLLLQYSGTLTDKSGATQFSVSLNFLLRGLLDNRDAEFELKRHHATADYTYLRMDLSRTENLAKGWSLFGKLEGQFTPSTLVSNEQFGIGGAESVRGYLESETLADEGLRATIEARRSLLDLYQPTGVTEMYAAAFYDMGAAWLRNAGNSTRATTYLAAPGIGFHARGWHGLSFGLDIAHALRAGPSTRSGETRLHLRLVYDY